MINGPDIDELMRIAMSVGERIPNLNEFSAPTGIVTDMEGAGPIKGTLLATSLRWRVGGFPRVVVDHRLAASMMATTIPLDLVREMRAPWPVFLLDVPTGLVSVPMMGDAPSDETQFATGAVVSLSDGSLGGDCTLILKTENTWVAVEHGPFVDTLSGRLNAPLCSHEVADEFDEFDALVGSEAAHATRVMVMIARLVVGATIELDATAARAGVAPGTPITIKTKRGEPVTNTFRLTRAVKIDCRAAVRDYTAPGHRARRGAPTVQSIVRGHWKHQPCGAGRAARKFIHVEPYWRGPEDAPIAVRSHTIAASETAQ